MMAADRCRQTLSILERTLDGGTSSRDADHVRGCAACTRAVGRLPAFDTDLRAAARGLALEPMPPALLGPSAAGALPGPTWTGRSTRAIGLVAMVVVIAVAAVLGARQLARFEGGPGGARPLIVSESSLVSAFADLGLSCRASIIDAKASPQRRGHLCMPTVPRSGIDVLGVIERGPAGDPIALIAKSTVDPVAGDAGRARVGDLIVKLAGTAFPDAADRAAAEAWVRSVLPAGDELVDQTTTIGGLDLTFQVIGPGHYFLQEDVPPS
jgi:hypothetical protein